MKAVMYHYVRPSPEHLPYFRYLHLDDFARQLDWFARCDRLLSREEFEDVLTTGTLRDGVILTFDDGLADHYEHVLPMLVDRGLFGIFYVCTGPLERRKLLDVHRIHLLLGKLGGRAALAQLSEMLDPGMLSDTHVENFREATYSTQDNDQATTSFKRILNYFISYEHREGVLDTLFKQEFEDDVVGRDFYLTAAQIQEMDRLGMVVGSHGVNHFVFSKLSLDGQREEIRRSFGSLAGLLGKPITTFCYPYGGGRTFTPDTVSLLEQAGSRYSFAVSPRPISTADLQGHRQALPRYDCNMFSHGRASFGKARAEQAA